MLEIVSQLTNRPGTVFESALSEFSGGAKPDDLRDVLSASPTVAFVRTAKNSGRSRVPFLTYSAPTPLGA